MCRHNLKVSVFDYTYAPINVKPQGGAGGGRATPGKLTESAFPWVGILTFKRCPRVGNLTWPPSWKTERNWKLVTCHLGDTQKSPEVNDLCFSSKYQDNMSERKVKKSVLFFGIYEPSLLHCMIECL